MIFVDGLYVLEAHTGHRLDQRLCPVWPGFDLQGAIVVLKKRSRALAVMPKPERVAAPFWPQPSAQWPLWLPLAPPQRPVSGPRLRSAAR